MKADLWPVYEFRPDERWLKEWGHGRASALYRYNGGTWTPDDGEYDLAFASIDSWPLCLYVELHSQRNILWSWLDGHWSAPGPSSHPWHKGSSSPNPWHYMLRPGTTKWGGPWGRDGHENEVAGRKGMSWVSSKRGCANGRSIEFKLRDQHIAAGLLRRRDTKEVVTFPEQPSCMYCQRENSGSVRNADD